MHIYWARHREMGSITESSILGTVYLPKTDVPDRVGVARVAHDTRVSFQVPQLCGGVL